MARDVTRKRLRDEWMDAFFTDLYTRAPDLTKKVDWDTAAASDADVVCRGATASDGGAATAITVTIATILWQQFIMRIHTLVGQILGYEANALPQVVESTPIVLRPSEGLSVHIINPTAASNLATNHYVVNCMWTEDAS